MLRRVSAGSCNQVVVILWTIQYSRLQSETGERAAQTILITSTRKLADGALRVRTMAKIVDSHKMLWIGYRWRVLRLLWELLKLRPALYKIKPLIEARKE